MTYERNYNLINNKFKELFFPTLMGSIAGNFAILVDAFFISLFLGSVFLSVVQTMEPFVSFVNVLYWLIGLGGSIVCTVARAEFDTKRSNSLFTVSMISILIVSLVTVLLSLLFHDQLVNLLCPNIQLRSYVSDYFLLYLVGVIPECYMVSLAYFIRTDGFIQLQFRAFLLCNVVNVIFDVILMYFLGYGIFGAALATTLGNIVSAVYISTYFFNADRSLKFIRVKSSEVLNFLKEVCRAGLSIATMPLYTTIRLLILNIIIIVFLGEFGLVAFNMCYNTQYLVNIFILGTVQSILPIVSVYFKEQDYNGVDYVINKSTKIALIFGVFFTALFAIFPQTILFIFNLRNPAHIPLAMNAVRIFSFSFLAFAINNLYIYYAQAIEEDKLANIITLLDYLVFPVLIMFIFTSIWKEDGIWISLVVSELATLIFIYAYSRYINRKSSGEYRGFYINKTNNDNHIYQFTIQGEVNEAVTVSREVQEYLSDENLSTIVAMAVEDMIVYLIDINEEIDLLDLIVRNTDESIQISIKYSGIPVNPTANNDSYSNISILKQMATNIDYSEILGLNNTVITINKNI